MFDIGFSELALISIIGLGVRGPERLPKAARTVGYWVGRARSTFNHLRNELEREALNQDMRERMEKQMREMGLDEDSIREARDNLLSEQEVARARRRPSTLEHEPLEHETREHDTSHSPSPGAEHPESEKKSND